MSMNPEDHSRLEQEAADVRGEGRSPIATMTSGMAPARAFLYLLLIGLCLFGSVVLLLSEPLRTGAVAALAGGISGYVDPGQQIFPMPAPRPTAPETIYFGSNPTVIRGGSDDVIYEPDEMSQPEAGAEPAEFVPAARSSSMEGAYDYLVENSDLAGRLSRGEVAGFTFKEWNPRVERDPVFFLDIVVVREADGEELTLVFQVDLRSETVRAANQEARDMERMN